MNKAYSLLFLFLALKSVQSVVQTDRANIVVVVADDLGINDVHYTGASDCYTPNIDEFHSNSVTLSRFYTYPLCTPTRAALLTGRYTFRYGLQDGVIQNGQPIGLPLDEITLPDELKVPPNEESTPYRTYMSGKWHLGFCKDEYTPPSRGFDKFYGVWSGDINRTLLMNPPRGKGAESWVGYDLHDGFDRIDPIPSDIFADDWFTVKMIDHLNDHVSGGTHESDPFFLTMAFTLPHEPIQTQGIYDDIPEISEIEDANRREFCSMVANMDANFGLLLDQLKSDQTVWENTIVIFFSDNGAVPTRFTGSNYPFRSGKGSVWEGGVRTPAIFGGGKLPSPRMGTFYDEMVHVSDLFPTILKLAGQTPSATEIDGFDLSNLFLTDSDSPDSIRSNIILQVHNDSSCQSALQRPSTGEWDRICGGIIDGQFKMVVGHSVSAYDTAKKGGWVINPIQDDSLYPPSGKLYRCPTSVPSWSTVKTEFPFVSDREGCLYDLETDPCETTNVASNYTTEYLALTDMLFAALDASASILTSAEIDDNANPANYADLYWRSWLSPNQPTDKTEL